MSNIATNNSSPAKVLSQYMDKFKGQIGLALPKHMNADRMTRLALTAFSQNKALQQCDMQSICASVVVAAQLGLEIGVNGQGYLVPYKGKATFVPGWKGLVDLVSRAGRANVWTGAVYEGDHFEYELGDNPRVIHKPDGDSDDVNNLTYVYAIGRINGSQYPVIEVWSIAKIKRHLARYNKVGDRHYAHTNLEMYARKVALLQVLKYMPASIELQKAIDVSNAVDSGRNFTFDGDIVVVEQDQETQQQETNSLPECTSQSFENQKDSWKMIIQSGKKTVNDLILTIETRELLTQEQKFEIDSWTSEVK